MASKGDNRPGFFCAFPSPWGPMGAVASEQGALRRIVLPHYPRDDLLELLAWEHPAATERRGPFEPLIEAVRTYFNDRRDDAQAALSLELPAESRFAGRVLRACREIPLGRTVGYLDLAKRIGREDAARAVATALGKNPLPLVVPCHRVRYSDGRLGGYSAAAGVELKQRLLQHEDAI